MVEAGAVPKYEPTRDDEFAAPVMTLPPMDYDEPPDLPKAFQQRNDLDKMMDQMEEEEAEMKRMGVMRVEDFEKVKREMGAAQLERESKLRSMAASEQDRIFDEMALRIQNCWRGKASRDAVVKKRKDLEKMVEMQKGALKIQTRIRAFLARARVRTMLESETRELVLGIDVWGDKRARKGRQVIRPLARQRPVM